jgi:putative ABC transport system permease protein
MKLHQMVWKELRERPGSLFTSSLAILLGVAALVAIRHVNVHSEQNISHQLSTLGANILILPKDASLQDYYAADQSDQTLPEEYVAEVYLAGLTGVEKLTPKLSISSEVDGQLMTLTGILPQSDFQTKAAWQTAAMFRPKKHQGCKKADLGPSEADRTPEALAHNRAIEELGIFEAVIGADVAQQSGWKVGDTIDLLGKSFQVLAILPGTGTVDDGRVFCHLHTVQELAGAGQVVSAIEVVGCCEDAAGDLVPRLRQLLPDAKVVTISQVVKTQVGVNRLMAKTSWFILAVLVIVGGASLAGAMAHNVRERRREIGTLMALGATPGIVLRMFLLKALVLGVFGGIAGCALGMGLALGLGPIWAGVAVRPLPGIGALSIAASSLLAIVAAFGPAWKAAQLDPCLCFQEI